MLSLLRGLHVAAMLSEFGTLTFAVAIAPSNINLRRTFCRQARIAGAIALIAGIGWLLLETQAMAGSIAPIMKVIAGTQFGNALTVRLTLLIITLALVSPRPGWLYACVGLAGVAVVLQPVMAHAGAMEGGAGIMLIASEGFHLLAAGAWLGGLLPLLTCIATLQFATAVEVSERFTPLALTCVGIIAITALLQAGQLIGSIPALVGTPYGRVAAAKLSLFAVALALAAVNRLVLVPRLWLHAMPTRRRLLGGIAAEAVVGLAIVLAAGLLATMTPAVHEQPEWPLPWRIDFRSMQDNAVQRQVVIGFGVVGVGVAIAAWGLFRHGMRVTLVSLGGAVVLIALPLFRPLLTEAYPTTFYRSPTGFAVGSIVHGRDLFAANCVSCHGAAGHGRGGAADLTAVHLWDHTDGDLFWYITQGRQPSDGGTAMPAYRDLLPEDDRWALIDFMHANNAGTALHRTGQWPVPIRAPGVPLVCDNASIQELADLRGSVVLVIADEPESNDAQVPDVQPQDGARVVSLHLGRGGPGCTAATHAAWEAFAILTGIAPEHFVGTALLTDPGGWLRTVWPPGQRAEWTSPDRLTDAVRQIGSSPIFNAIGELHEPHH